MQTTMLLKHSKICNSNTENVEISTPCKCYKNAEDMQDGIIAIKCFNAWAILDD